MRILLITDSYPPEVRSAAQLMKDLAEGLSQKGHSVSVATTYPQYNLADFPADNTSEISEEGGIEVLRIKTLPHHKVNFIIRGISQVLMPWIFFRKIKSHFDGKIDAVIVHSPPLPLTIAARKIKKLYGAKYILNLHDIFPQNAVDLGILGNKFLIKMFERMEKAAYSEADLIIVPSYEHKKFIEAKRGVSESKIDVVYHWIDSRPYIRASKTGKFRKLYGLEGKFIFLFGGVLGPSQGLDLVIRIAEKLKDKDDIVFLFVGDGTAKESLERLAQEKKLTDVIFKPFVPADEYPELVKDCDVGIISLSSLNTTPAVPAKILGYMAAAIPVVAFLQKESDGLAIIKEAKCGYGAISSDEDKSLEAALNIYKERKNLKVMGQNGLNYLLKNMEKSVGVSKFEDDIRKITRLL